MGPIENLVSNADSRDWVMAEGCGSGWAGEGRRPRILVVENDVAVAEAVREVLVAHAVEAAV